jgi:hypothetical protein
MNEDEFREWQDYKRLKNEAEEMDVFPPSVKHAWIKTKDTSLFCTNPEYEQPTFDPDKIDWEFILKDIEPIDVAQIHEDNFWSAEELTGHFDKLIVTDEHIGMDVNKDGLSLYGGKWDEEELDKRIVKTIIHCLVNQNSKLLIIDDLGDTADGWDGKTERKQHKLPQNMNNRQQFDVGLRFKIKLTEGLKKYYDKIIWHNATKCNHSFDLTYIICSGFKNYAEARWIKGVKVYNHEKFIDHYRVGNNTFILTHGKDDENVKYGFPTFLDKVAEKKINEYIDENYLLESGVHIEFIKGDKHQANYDECTSPRFFYYSIPAYSPASNWVQSNFQKGRSGCYFANYLYEDEPMSKSEHKLWFKWEK